MYMYQFNSLPGTPLPIQYMPFFQSLLKLTSFVRETDDILSTLRTIVGMLLMFLQTFLAEHLSTAVDLLWVSGHTQADQTEEAIRRGLHKLMVRAFQIYNIGCHS